MSDQDQARLNQAKESLLAAGKQAQKDKDAAKADYEKEKEYGMVSDDQALAQWYVTNLCDDSAAKEWQQAQREATGKLLRAGDIFESNHHIGLPDE
ncbi:unnamed protein product [Fusarium equiseti]|uniref:Uncharacterized protein n=1 Tax=Fusarium equiseti TaxID=61235 RepID=A0A8J2JB64_FUSEQ|nr:unnamed protein product [Fusarium equiseti]